MFNSGVRKFLTLALYNTPAFKKPPNGGRRCRVLKCPECAAVLDVDEDEVEEGEIMSCPECEVELEVVQVNPVHINVISDETEAEEDEEESEEGDDKKKDKKEEDLTEDEEEE
jgi:alpha-aminoadipate carrier protein LysW